MLDEFIRHKLATYHEPSRRGTPKGEKIGFGRQKYHAALRLMNSADIKEVGEDVGVSEGLLGKWKTDDEFKTQIERNAEGFIDDLGSVLREQAKKDGKTFDRFLNAPFKEGEKLPASSISENVIADVD